ncbi:homoserine kinase [Oscillospiraceae bacterium MB08-C2-2]|nr:homoserine kinase [Oscillospiraceae bacterium MB08-C2-2]
MIKVRIPATSANLGAGFDCLGLALSLYNEIEVAEAQGLHITSKDDTEIPTGEDNLVYQTVRHLYELCGRPFPGLSLLQTNRIPLARGLGSSSACIAGGLIGGNALLGNPFSLDELIVIAAQLEGHPDNSTPALLGGLVTAVMDGEKVYYTHQRLPKDLAFAAIIPDFELRTSYARKALPDAVSHMDARFNAGRAALMATSLATGQYQNLAAACQDRLHQPYRIGLIDRGSKTLELCQSSGALASFISGSGSTLLAIFEKENADFPTKIREGLADLRISHWGLHILEGDNKGACLLDEAGTPLA